MSNSLLVTIDNVEAYRTLVIAQGLELWAKHKIQPNRSYTPGRMIDAARSILGTSSAKLGRRDYLGHAKALRALINSN